jgi:hypothetical protein
MPPLSGSSSRRSLTVPSVAGSSKATRIISPAHRTPGLDTVTTVVAIVKEVGEILRGVPYVKAVSGIVLHIIAVKEVDFNI